MLDTKTTLYISAYAKLLLTERILADITKSRCQFTDKRILRSVVKIVLEL